MGWQKTLIVLAMVSGAAQADDPFQAFYNGNRALEFCLMESQDRCMAYVAGMNDALQYSAPQKDRYCLPPGVTLRQTADLYLKHLRENPADRHLAAIVLFRDAMTRSFPCSAPLPDPNKIKPLPQRPQS